MNTRALALLSAALAVTPLQSQAFPVIVRSGGPGVCDQLAVPEAMHELGVAPFFPLDELIAARWQPTALTPCPRVNDDPAMGNWQVSITNLSGLRWRDLHFVEDGPFIHANYDGFIQGQRAHRIDAVGANLSLVSESMNADGVFEPGETWDFLVQDWIGNPLAFNFTSPGAVGNDGVPPGSNSTASIVALIATPEPGTLALLGLGLAGLGLSRRRRVN